MPIGVLLVRGELRRDGAGLVQHQRRRVHRLWRNRERLHRGRVSLRHQRRVRIGSTLRERQLRVRCDLVPDGLLLGGGRLRDEERFGVRPRRRRLLRLRFER